MDLDDADIRLLNDIRQARLLRGRERLFQGLLTLVFASLSVACFWLTPDISTSPRPELDIIFELLRWQARATFLPLALVFGMGAFVNFVYWGLRGDQDRRDALILKLLDRRALD